VCSSDLLRDTTFGPTELPTPAALKFFWIVLTIVGVTGAVLLLEFLIRSFRRIFSEPPASGKAPRSLFVLVLSAVLLYFFALQFRIFMDRYLLILWLLTLILVAASAARPASQRWSAEPFPGLLSSSCSSENSPSGRRMTICCGTASAGPPPTT
jgi:hypothetical protein